MVVKGKFFLLVLDKKLLIVFVGCLRQVKEWDFILLFFSYFFIRVGSILK